MAGKELKVSQVLYNFFFFHRHCDEGIEI